MTILDYFEKSKTQYPDKTAIKDLDESFTYKELYERAVFGRSIQYRR